MSRIKKRRKLYYKFFKLNCGKSITPPQVILKILKKILCVCEWKFLSEMMVNLLPFRGFVDRKFKWKYLVVREKANLSFWARKMLLLFFVFRDIEYEIFWFARIIVRILIDTQKFW